LEHNSDTTSVKEHGHGTIKNYVIGFILSIILTMIAYFIVAERLLNNFVLDVTISIIALAQVLCQLLFFLHLGDEPKPRWNLHAFFFMLLVVVIIVGGTLWIMYNLEYRTMSMITL